MRALVEEAGLGAAVEIDSAGTHDYEIGDPPDERAIAAARRRGLDISHQRARRVGRDDFARFDLILALDRGHRSILRHMAPPGLGDRVRLLMEFTPGAPPDVPDPFYGDAGDFDAVRDLIERGVAGLLDWLVAEGAV